MNSMCMTVMPKKSFDTSCKSADTHWFAMLIYRYRWSGNGSLIISEAVLEDSGMFQCFAFNAAGHTMAATWLRITSM